MKKIFVLALSTFAFIPVTSAQWEVTQAPKEIQAIFTAANIDPSEFASEWEENIAYYYSIINFPIDLVTKNNLSPSDSLIYDRTEKKYYLSDSIQTVESRDSYSWVETVQEIRDSSLIRAIAMVLYSAPSVLERSYTDGEGQLSLLATYKIFPQLRTKTIEWLTPMFFYNYQRQDKFRKEQSLKALTEVKKYVDSLTPAKIECEKKYLASEKAEKHWEFGDTPPNATCDGPNKDADSTFRPFHAFILRRVLNDGIPVTEIKTTLANLKNKLVPTTAKK